MRDKVCSTISSTDRDLTWACASIVLYSSSDKANVTIRSVMVWFGLLFDAFLDMGLTIVAQQGAAFAFKGRFDMHRAFPKRVDMV